MTAFFYVLLEILIKSGCGVRFPAGHPTGGKHPAFFIANNFASVGECSNVPRQESEELSCLTR